MREVSTYPTERQVQEYLDGARHERSKAFAAVFRSLRSFLRTVYAGTKDTHAKAKTSEKAVTIDRAGVFRAEIEAALAQALPFTAADAAAFRSGSALGLRSAASDEAEAPAAPPSADRLAA
jgi:hypothetical protein